MQAPPGLARAKRLAEASEVDEAVTWIARHSSTALPTGMCWVTAQGPVAVLCQPLPLLDFLPP